MRRYDQCDKTCTTDCGHCKGDPTAPTCDVDGCDDRAAVVVTSTIDDLRHFVCYRCADELTARDTRWRSR